MKRLRLRTTRLISLSVMAVGLLGCSLGATPSTTDAEATRVGLTGATVPRTPPPGPSAPSASTDPQPQPRPAPVAWLFYGDSLTDDGWKDPAAWLASWPAGAPRELSVGLRGADSGYGLSRLDEALAYAASAGRVGLSFGTNDLAHGRTVADFREDMRTMARRVMAAGKQPMFAQIPYSRRDELADLPDYNRALRDLERALGLVPGPDLFALTHDRPELLGPDGVHMTAEGAGELQRSWAEVIRGGGF